MSGWCGVLLGGTWCFTKSEARGAYRGGVYKKACVDIKIEKLDNNGIIWCKCQCILYSYRVMVVVVVATAGYSHIPFFRNISRIWSESKIYTRVSHQSWNIRL